MRDRALTVSGGKVEGNALKAPMKVLVYGAGVIGTLMRRKFPVGRDWGAEIAAVL
jgi:hypothetical protein